MLLYTKKGPCWRRTERASKVQPTGVQRRKLVLNLRTIVDPRSIRIAPSDRALFHALVHALVHALARTFSAAISKVSK